MRTASLGTSSFSSPFRLCRECLANASCALPLVGTLLAGVLSLGTALNITCHTCNVPFSVAGLWQAGRTAVSGTATPPWAGALPTQQVATSTSTIHEEPLSSALLTRPDKVAHQ